MQALQPVFRKALYCLAVASLVSLMCWGCEFDSSLSATSCSEDPDCPGQSSCIDGWCVTPVDQDASIADALPNSDASSDGGDTGAGCLADQLECDGRCVERLSDPDHCGGCNQPCTGDDLCVQGQCEEACDDGLTVCGGTCVDLQSDPKHCDTCEHACPEPAGSTAVCDMGSCDFDCDAGLEKCGDACLDLTDPGSCGGCNVDCEVPDNGVAVCVSDSCDFDCDTDYEKCEGGCVDFDSDPDHCGKCGNDCPDPPNNASRSCRQGECGFVCDSGLARCDDACVDFDDDPDNCGRCGRSCASGSCNGGVCDPLDCDPAGKPGHPFGGGSGDTNDPFTICAEDQLNALGDGTGYLDARFVLSSDIRLTGAVNRIGDDSDPFEGHFYGDGFTISELTIDDSGLDDAGLFGAIDSDSVVADLYLEAVDITAHNRVGALAGRNTGTVANVHVLSGSVSGHDDIGGLVGLNYGAISDASASIAVDGQGNVGGLVGYNRATITDSHASGAVESTGARVGGLVGYSRDDGDPCHILRCSATGPVSAIGAGEAGGLVGTLRDECEVRQSFAGGDVTATTDSADEVGGLIGRMRDNTLVTTSYALGDVDADDELGGLLGRSSNGNDEIHHCYATGSVIGDDQVGGLVGEMSGNIVRSYWNTDTSGLASSDGGAPLDRSQFSDTNSFDQWDFVDVWRMSSGEGRPVLRWE